MTSTGEVERDILQDLERRGSCSIEEMVTHLSGYTWNQVFSAVDRLSRNAQVTLQHPSRFGYQISLAHAHCRVLTSQRQQAGNVRPVGSIMPVRL